jgi:hypothetical protein
MTAKKAAPETALIQTGTLQNALALATEQGDIPALKDVAAMAAALQKGAKARGMGVASENQAAEVVVRAERAIGEVLISMAQQGLRVGARDPRNMLRAQAARYGRDEGSQLVRLQDLGVSPMESTRWRQLASVPEAQFNSLIAEAREKVERLAKADFYRLATRGKTKLEPIRSVAAAQSLIERQDAKADAETSQFDAFKQAASALDMSQLPLDELAAVAGIITDLVARYKAEKGARGG